MPEDNREGFSTDGKYFHTPDTDKKKDPGDGLQQSPRVPEPVDNIFDPVERRMGNRGGDKHKEGYRTGRRSRREGRKAKEEMAA